jgi:hypothetical protein
LKLLKKNSEEFKSVLKGRVGKEIVFTDMEGKELIRRPYSSLAPIHSFKKNSDEIRKVKVNLYLYLSYLPKEVNRVLELEVEAGKAYNNRFYYPSEYDLLERDRKENEED